MVTLIDCFTEGGFSRFAGIVLSPLIVAVWVAAVVVIWRKTPEGGRIWIAFLLIWGFLLGFLNFSKDLGSHGDFARFALILVLSAIIGFVVSHFSPAVGGLRGAATAVLGNLVPVGMLLFAIVWTLSLNGECFTN